MHEPATYTTFRCDGCTQVSLYIWSALHSPDSEFGQQIFPYSLHNPQHLPAPVKAAYRQAQRVKSQSNVAYAVLARKVLEAIAIDRELRGHSLAKALPILLKRGELPPLLAEAAELIRTFGNAAAHEPVAVINGLHVELIEKFLALLVEYMYTAPSILQELKHHLDLETNDQSVA